MKIKENVFFKCTKARIATLPSRSENSIGLNSRYEKANIETRSKYKDYNEVNVNFGNEDWSTLNFMRLLGEEETNEESFLNNDSDKIEDKR